MALVTLTKENFKELVLDAAQPVLVDFWAPWCTYCRRLNPVLDRVAEKLQGSVTVGKINIDEEPQLAEQFDVEVIPTLYVFKNGVHGDKLVAPDSQEAVLSFVERA